MKNRQSGFTLIELVMVTILLAIVATYAAMRFPSQASMQASGFASTFLQDLQLTAALSISGNQRYRMVISSSSYQIQDASLTPIILPGTQPGVGSTTNTAPAGVTITGLSGIIFDSLGTPYDLNNVALSAPATFTISSGTSSRTITVTPQTGYVK